MSAVLRITSEDEKIVYFTQGHGEKTLDDGEDSGIQRAKSVLESLGYDVFALNLLMKDGVPEDADTVVTCGPQKDLFKEELDSMASYLEKGGALLILVDPHNLPNLEQFCIQLLAKYYKNLFNV